MKSADFAVGDQVTGLASQNDAVLVCDPDGAVIELSEATADARDTTFDGLRIAAIDIDATATFMTAIGFIELQSPTTVQLRGDQLGARGPSEIAECRLARYTLAEDGGQFTVTMVEHPDTRAHEAVPWAGNRQRLYRCALRVDSVDRALDALLESAGAARTGLQTAPAGQPGGAITLASSSLTISASL